MSNLNNRLRELLETVSRSMVDHAEELTELDRAIGDGDHGLNMKRGFEEVLSKLDDIAAKSWPQALHAAGMTLVMKVGGASGPLYGTLMMSLGKTLPDGDLTVANVAQAFDTAVDAVKARGRSEPGQKTMLDVLVPVCEAFHKHGPDPTALREVATQAAQATVPMKALKGRASFLGDRSIGHMDPGACSSALLVSAVCDVMEGRQ